MLARWWILLIAFAMILNGCAGATEAPASMVDVPAGWFLMGSDDGRRANGPEHHTYLDAFAIDRTEVTIDAFRQFIEQTGYIALGWSDSLLSENPNKPMVGVLWRDAQAYCKWAGKRLPTEAEWEKAARSEDGRRYPWGDQWDPARANTLESGIGDVVAVGSYPSAASPYGALDMAGNAAEWVYDYYDPTYYTYGPTHNPSGPTEILDHGLRGGSWDSAHEHVQTTFRDSSHSVRPNVRVGFRCAVSLP